jgi:methionine-rich copper-binding protein CopC
MRRLLTLLGVAVLATATPAIAHGPVGAEPGPGATVGGRIDEVAITFGELMSPDGMSIVVTDPQGAEVPLRSEVTLDENEQVARVEIEPLAEPGEYRVDYVVSGIDGVTTPGAYVFTFEPSADPPVPVPVPEPVLTASGGPNWGAFALGLVAAGAMLLVFSGNARRAR